MKTIPFRMIFTILESMSNELTSKMGQFDEIILIIDNARTRALKAVNAELIQMYWEIGAYVKRKSQRWRLGEKHRSGFFRLFANALPHRERFLRAEHLANEAVL